MKTNRHLIHISLLGAVLLPVLASQAQTTVTKIAAGSQHTLFIKSDGSLWAMGYNAEGQLGDGTFNDAHQPERIVRAGVTAIAAGDAHSLFLMADGSLWGMGQSFVGQLGAVAPTNQPRPVQIVGPMVGNGGFESGDFTGWGQALDIFSSVATVSHTGSYAARMGQEGG